MWLRRTFPAEYHSRRIFSGTSFHPTGYPARNEWQQLWAVVDAMGIEVEMTVADLGAGTGYFIPYLAEAVGEEGTGQITMVGFLPGDHPCVVSTIDAIEQNLTDPRGLVYRYRTDDGLAGEEGSFLLCTFWLAQARAIAGQTDRARRIFERAIEYCNDLGLFSEEVHPETGELLGNFPQAFSHIGLVTAAWTIQQAEA